MLHGTTNGGHAVPCAIFSNISSIVCGEACMWEHELMLKCVTLTLNM